MLRNYLKTAWRNLWRGLVFNLMNIVGLSVAICCCILLFLTVYYEFSYDRFHKNIDDIYQVYFTSNKAAGTERSTSMPVGITPPLKASYPDIKYATRMNGSNATVRYGSKEVHRGVSFVDPDFLKMFTFPLISGDPNTALSGMNDAVITEYAAKTIFGSQNPLGKVISLKCNDTTRSFKITALAKDFPQNSSINFDILVRFENAPNYLHNLQQWDNHNCVVYLQINPNTTADALTGKLIKFTNRQFKQDIASLTRDGGHKDANGNVFTINLTPFANNHFNTDLSGLSGASISKLYVLSLLIIGAFILVIACINFINLSVARGLTRAREVGVRKTLGAGKWQLLTQFWLETLIVCLVALGLGIILSMGLLPLFKRSFRSNISFNMLLQPMPLLTGIGAFVLLTVISGFYPALLMVRYKTVQVLKGSVNAVKPGKIRNVLLVVQFTLSTLLIVCTIVTWQQITYLHTKPLGYNKTEVISIPVLDKGINGQQALNLFRNKLNAMPIVESVTGTYANFGFGVDGTGFTSIMGFSYKGHDISAHEQRVDYDFVKTMDIKMVDGRDFSHDYPTDSNAVVINEKLAALIGSKNVVGTFLPLHDNAKQSQIIGIVKDYNFQSLHEQVKPMLLVMDKNFTINYILVRVKPGNLVNHFDEIKKAWLQTFPSTQFNGSWLDDNTQRQYAAEQRLTVIFIESAIVAIVISCIGLLAISIMIMLQRTKEVGIRKILGANISSIVAMLSVDFLKLVFIAALISFPMAWWIMEKWLQGFPYRIFIHWWVFVIATVAALLIAFVTISFQAIKTATTNPVKSLRSE